MTTRQQRQRSSAKQQQQQQQQQQTSLPRALFEALNKLQLSGSKERRERKTSLRVNPRQISRPVIVAADDAMDRAPVRHDSAYYTEQYGAYDLAPALRSSSHAPSDARAMNTSTPSTAADRSSAADLFNMYQEQQAILEQVVPPTQTNATTPSITQAVSLDDMLASLRATLERMQQVKLPAPPHLDWPPSSTATSPASVTPPKTTLAPSSSAPPTSTPPPACPRAVRPPPSLTQVRASWRRRTPPATKSARTTSSNSDQSPPAPRLPRLPADVVRVILQDATRDSSEVFRYDTLLSACLVDREWHEVATGLLFERLVLYEIDRINDFVKAFTTSPAHRQLLRHTKQISYTGLSHYLPSQDHPRDKVFLYSSYRVLHHILEYSTQVEELEIAHRKRRMYEHGDTPELDVSGPCPQLPRLRTLSLDACLDVLPLLNPGLSSLKHLSIVSDHNPSFNQGGRVRRFPTDFSPSFTLESVTLRDLPSSYGEHCALLLVPSIATLRTVRLVNLEEAFVRSLVGAFGSNVEHLEISFKGTNRITTLELLLGNTPNLKILRLFHETVQQAADFLKNLPPSLQEIDIRDYPLTCASIVSALCQTQGRPTSLSPRPSFCKVRIGQHCWVEAGYALGWTPAAKDAVRQTCARWQMIAEFDQGDS